MAMIHQTTVTPGKLEMLAEWLPKQDWFRPGGGELARAGGFRLDDPAGEVGIEVYVVTDDRAAYLVPMAYRGAPLEGAPEGALIGVTEHGVLGTRWFYDAEQDPVAHAQFAELLAGRAVPQHQDESDTVDDTVAVAAAPEGAAVTVTLRRELTPAGEPAPGEVVAGYTAPDGSAARAVFLTAGA
ncbi:1,4-alpha-glucan branching protein [Kitasatospora sp. NPDC059795]|uniref:maltokinase N-terminal cap-like domain-containing protein n=1 Tax=Kitasatospora sp. NPDC059795 TaxID=3346949 RepID=UPI00365B7656